MAKPGSPIFKCSRRHEVHDFEIYDNLHDMFGTHDQIKHALADGSMLVSNNVYQTYTYSLALIVFGYTIYRLLYYLLYTLFKEFLYKNSQIILFLFFQVVYGDVYMLDDEMKWKVVSPMPKPNSHIESSWVILNNSIIIMGGTTEKHPVTKRMILVGEMFQFHLDSLVSTDI